MAQRRRILPAWDILVEGNPGRGQISHVSLGLGGSGGGDIGCLGGPAPGQGQRDSCSRSVEEYGHAHLLTCRTLSTVSTTLGTGLSGSL